MMYDTIQKSDDNDRKRWISSDFQMINRIVQGVAHEDTKFHCYGDPLKEADYYEDEWVVRSYHALLDNLPEGINLVPSFKYKTKFTDLQEKLSKMHNATFFISEVRQILFSLRREEWMWG